jgi:hypothetical protein
MEVERIKGDMVPPNTLQRISEIFLSIWPEDLPLPLVDKNILAQDTFFLVNNSSTGEILSAGRLRPVVLSLAGRKVDVCGIADIVAVKKRQGYGGILMNGIREYLKQCRTPGIGFCDRENSPFYRKIGFYVDPDLIGRFAYPVPGGIPKRNTDADDVILSKDDPALVDEIRGTVGDIAINRPFW